jgi:hypothetical protein
LLLIGAALAAGGVSAKAQGNCTNEAASIRRAEGQLPRLSVAPPNDQQIVCITLETNILFARRLAAHLKHCPRSPLARAGAAWSRPETDYLSQFSSPRRKPAIRPYRD